MIQTSQRCRASPRRNIESMQIGKYILLETIKTGDFGVVYKGIKKQTSQTVAVKVIDTIKNGGVDEAYSFRALKIELSLMPYLNHLNVVKTLDFFKEEGQIFIVMEYCQSNLSKWLQNKRFYSEKELLIFFSQILTGLEYLHSRKLIHRKLRLDNILVQGEVCKLSNFGVSKYIERGGPQYLFQVNHPKPRAPIPARVLNGLCYGQGEDIWSAGAILFYILFGKYPSEKKTLNRNYAPLRLPFQQNTKHPFEISMSLSKLLTSILNGEIISCHAILQQIKQIVNMPLTDKLLLSNIDLPHSETTNEKIAIDFLIFSQRNLMFRDIYEVDYISVTQHLRNMQIFPQQIFNLLLQCLKIDQIYKYSFLIQAKYPQNTRTATQCERDVVELQKKAETGLLQVQDCKLKRKLFMYMINLRKVLIEKRGEWATKVTDIEDQWTSIIMDRLSKTFYSEQTLRKDKFLTGLEGTDYSREEQITFCNQYFQKYIRRGLTSLTNQFIDDPALLWEQLNTLTKFNWETTRQLRSSINQFFKVF